MITQTYIVNMRVGAGIAPKVKISQGDIGRNLAFKLFDGVSAFTPPAGSTAEITGRKPSGLGFSENCTMSGNTVTVSTTLDISQESGNVLAELKITNGSAVVGTANFVIYVEPAAHPDGTTDGTTEEARTVLAQCAQYAQEAQEAAEAASGDYTEIRSDVDDLTDRVEALESGGGGSGLTPSIKNALLACFANVAWKDDDGQTYYDALESALFEVTLTGITAVYTQSSTVIYSDDSLDRLKSGLVVTAYYDNGTSQVLTENAYTLSGSLSSATSTITVAFSGKTATFNVSVTLVGSTEYSDALSNWFLTATPTATYSDGKITIKGTQSNANAFKLLCFDRAKTLWDTVEGKKLRVRATMDSPDWTGDVSTSSPQNRVVVGLAVYANASITTGNDRQKYTSLNSAIIPASTPTTYEFVFDADISNFESGSGTPSDVSTFGVFIYNASANTLEITGCSIVEVLTS